MGGIAGHTGGDGRTARDKVDGKGGAVAGVGVLEEV